MPLSFEAFRAKREKERRGLTGQDETAPSFQYTEPSVRHPYADHMREWDALKRDADSYGLLNSYGVPRDEYFALKGKPDWMVQDEEADRQRTLMENPPSMQKANGGFNFHDPKYAVDQNADKSEFVPANDFNAYWSAMQQDLDDPYGDITSLHDGRGGGKVSYAARPTSVYDDVAADKREAMSGRAYADSEQLYKYYLEHEQEFKEALGQYANDISASYYKQQRQDYSPTAPTSEQQLDEMYDRTPTKASQIAMRYEMEKDGVLPRHEGGAYAPTEQVLQNYVDQMREKLNGLIASGDTRSQEYKTTLREVNSGERQLLRVRPDYVRFDQESPGEIKKNAGAINAPRTDVALTDPQYAMINYIDRIPNTEDGIDITEFVKSKFPQGTVEEQAAYPAIAMVQDFRLDKIYTHMSNSEKGIYNTIYHTEGKEKAEEYLRSLYKELAYRQNIELRTDFANYAKEHPFEATMVSIGMTPFQGVGLVGGLEQLVGGEYYTPYSGVYGPTAVKDTIRGTVTQDMGPVGQTLYGAGTSVGDMLSLVMAFGSYGGRIGLPVASYTGTQMNAALKGADGFQSNLMAASDATIEALTETIGWRRLRGLFESGDMLKYGFKHTLRQLGYHALSEGLEEIPGPTAHLFFDTIFMGANSEYNRRLNGVGGPKMTSEEAKDSLFKEVLSDTLQSFAGGFVAGGVMAGGADIGGSIVNSQQVAGVQKQIIAENPWMSKETALQIAQQRTGMAPLTIAPYEQAQQEYNENQTGIKQADDNTTGEEAGTSFSAQPEQEESSYGVFDVPARVNDEDIILNGIESIGKDAAYKTIEGNRVGAESADIHDPQMRALYRTAQNFESVEAANTYLGLYEENKMPAETYMAGYHAYYEAGARGLPMETLNNTLYHTALTEDTQNFAYTLGRTGRQAAAAKAWGDFPTEIKDGHTGVVKAYVRANISNDTKMRLAIVDSVGKELGIRVIVSDSLGDANAMYKGGNTMYVALDAIGGGITKALSHEGLHYLRRQNESEYFAIRNYMLSKLGDISGSMKAVVEKHKRLGISITEDVAIEEVLADAMPDIFLRRENVEQMAKEQPGALRRMLDWLSSTLKKIKEKFKGTREYETLAKDVETFDRLASMFREALERVKGTEESINLPEAVGTRYSLKTINESDLDIDENIRAVANMAPVKTLKGNEFDKGSKKLVDQVQDYFESIGGSVENDFIGKVIMNRAGAKSDVSHGIGRLKSITFAAIPSVVSKGYIIDFQKNWKGRGYDTVVISAPIEVSEGQHAGKYFVAAVIERRLDTQTFYLHELITQRRTDMPFKTGPRTTNGTTSGQIDPSLLSLLRKVQSVNSDIKDAQDIEQNADNGIRYSLKDIGRNANIPKPTLSDAQLSNLMWAIDDEGRVRNDSTREWLRDGIISDLKGKGIKQIDAYHVTDVDPSVLRREGINGTELDYVGRKSGNLREASVYMFADPHDIDNGYPGINSATNAINNVIHLKIPIDEIVNLMWDSNFNVTYGTYSSMRLEGNVPPEYIAGAYKYYSHEVNKDIRYSLKDTTDANTAAVMEDNEKLREVVENLKRQFTITEGVQLRREDISKVAAQMLKDASSTYDRATLESNLEKVFTYLANNKYADMNQAMAAMADISKAVLEKSRTLNKEAYVENAELRKRLRETPIALTSTQYAEVKSALGSFNAYRQRLFGSARIGTKGTPLDVLWEELTEQYPHFFPADTGEGEMPFVLMDAVNNMKPYYENPYGMNLDEYSADMALQVFEAYQDVRRLPPTFADRKKAEIEAATAKYREILRQVRDEYRDRMKNERNKLYDNLRERDKRRTEAQTKSNYIEQIKKTAGRLSKRLLDNTDKSNIPEAFKQSVLDMLRLLDFTTPRMGEVMTGKLNALRLQYVEMGKGGSYSDSLLSDEYEDFIGEMLGQLSDATQGKRISELTKSDLKLVYDVVHVINHMIVTANELFMQEKMAGVEEAGRETMFALNQKKGRNDWIIEGKHFKLDFSMVQNMLQEGLMTPDTFFAQFEGTPVHQLYDALRDGLDTHVMNNKQTEDFLRDAMEKYEYKKWDRKAKHTITTEYGDTVEMTLEELLTLWATWRRERRVGTHHIDKGGVSTEANKSKYPVTMTMVDMGKVAGILTQQQMDYVDHMVGYLTSVGSKWGNDVSMKLNGIMKFTESYYIPFKVNRNFVKSSPGQTSDVRIKSGSQTKALTEKASTPIVIMPFTQLWSSHAETQSMYNAFALPIEDFTRVWNYKSVKDDPGASVKGSISRAFTGTGNKYIENFLSDLNGGAIKPVGEGVFNKLVGLSKAGAVSANLSVMLQQASAGVRAMAEVDAKYFVPGSIKGTLFAKSYKELLQWCPTAQLKKWGYFDTNMTSTIYQRAKGGAMEKIKDAAAFGAQKMDEMNWAQIWEAVKLETAATHPDLIKGSEEFMRTAARRMRDVIDRTQVVDSVFHRTEWARSKSIGMKLVTAFRSEPSLMYNMLFRAARDFAAGKKGRAARYTGAVMLGITLNAALAAIAYGLRDRENEKKDKDGNIIGVRGFWDKYYDSFVAKLIDAPFTMMPVVADVYTMFQGWDAKRLDLVPIEKIVDAVKALTSDKPLKQKIWKAVDAISTISGIPFYNVMRDTEAVVMTIHETINHDTLKGMAYDVTQPIDVRLEAARQNISIDKNSDIYYDMLVMAEMSNNQKDFDAVKNEMVRQGKKEEDIYKALKSRIRTVEPLVHEAGKLYVAGDAGEYETAIGRMEKAGYSRSMAEEMGSSEGDYIKGKVAEMYNLVIEGDEEAADKIMEGLVKRGYTEDYFIELMEKYTPKQAAAEKKDVFTGGTGKAVYTYSMMTDAIMRGDKKNAEIMLKQFMGEGAARSTVKAQITKAFRPVYFEAYLKGDTAGMVRIENAIKRYASYEKDDFAGWIVESFYDDLYTAIDSGDGKLAEQIRTDMAAKAGGFGKVRDRITNKYKAVYADMLTYDPEGARGIKQALLQLDFSSVMIDGWARIKR